MTDKTVLTIDITPEAREQIEELARRRGYDAASDYVLALIESDAKAYGEAVSLEDEDTQESLLEGFRQSWHEAMTGQTLPLSSLWDDSDDDE